jgi:tRNA isopentenyl-2-thiomethyl-A-37 hydroxylase MiaE
MIRFNKWLDRDLSPVGDKEIIKFYNMLLKYKSRHPNFNINRVISKLYPRLDWKSFMLNQK